jgi:hypothetical protein
MANSSPPNLSSLRLTSTSTEQSFSTVHDVIERPKGAGLSSTVQTSLEVLKDILEAVDTLPCVKYVAGIAIKILEVTGVCPIDQGEHLLCLIS